MWPTIFIVSGCLLDSNIFYGMTTSPNSLSYEREEFSILVVPMSVACSKDLLTMCVLLSFLEDKC